MNHLSADDILLIHSFVVDETSGSHGLRDQHALAATAELPKRCAFGKELYPDVYTKAAVYARNIIYSHPFMDGNKRTAVTVAAVFLEDNGYAVVAKEGEIERFALAILSERLELAGIAVWLKKHTRKQRL